MGLSGRLVAMAPNRGAAYVIDQDDEAGWAN
jgi:hypothetical protein